MLRICFNRRNKTLRASWLGNKQVLLLIERNYRLWCATNDIPVDDDLVMVDNDDEMWEVVGDEVVPAPAAMDVDDEEDDMESPLFFKSEPSSQVEKTRSHKTYPKVYLLIKEKVRRVLEDVTDLADKRSGKCDENDFLRLLGAFNAEGIHFS